MKITSALAVLSLAPVVAFGALGPRSVLELPPGPGNPRNSEGDFAVLGDGSVLFVYSHYTKGNGGDHDPACLCSRVSRDGGRTWSAESREVVPNEGGMNVMCASFLRLRDGALALFYLRKNSQTDCRPVMRVSRDEGRSWSPPVLCVPDAEKAYYVLENCRVEMLSSGRIVMPLCLHESRDGAVSDWHGKLVCWLSDDAGRTWRRGSAPFSAFDAAGNRIVLQEPGVVELKDGRVLMYARTCHGRQWFFTSSDRGETWSAGRPSQLMGPCSPATLKRLSNGDLVAVWNDHADYPEFAARDGKGGTRLPLSVAVSKDDGVTWCHRRTVGDERDGGWYCYFGVLEHEGNLLIGYCARDALRHLRVTAVPLDWIYGGGDPGLPRRGFAGVREGPFWGLSTALGVWSAKPGEAEIRAWARGKGVFLPGGEGRRAHLELPVGTTLADVRLFAERCSPEGDFAFTAEGRGADGSWRRLASWGNEAKAGQPLALAFPDADGEMTALRFTCTSAAGVRLTD